MPNRDGILRDVLIALKDCQSAFIRDLSLILNTTTTFVFPPKVDTISVSTDLLNMLASIFRKSMDCGVVSKLCWQTTVAAIALKKKGKSNELLRPYHFYTGYRGNARGY